jgi:hypothetical protein
MDGPRGQHDIGVRKWMTLEPVHKEDILPEGKWKQCGASRDEAGQRSVSGPQKQGLLHTSSGPGRDSLPGNLTAPSVVRVHEVWWPRTPGTQKQLRGPAGR